MKLRQLTIPAALSVLAFLGTSAHAGTEPQVKDASGDARTQQAGHDIVGVSYEVTKTVTKTTKTVKGKKITVTTTTPKNLVITLKLAGAPSQQPGVLYDTSVNTACGALELQSYYDSTAQGMVDYSNFAECGPDNTLAGVTINTYDLTPDVVFGADSIAYTMSWKSLPKEIKLGQTWDSPSAYTALADPLLGFDTVTFVDPATAIDDASGSSFKLS
ncbi:MAG: hypothetical protein QOE64_385 [Frankiales bacterium]|nr:hypothetical protein [Frankiales bacterium]